MSRKWQKPLCAFPVAAEPDGDPNGAALDEPFRAFPLWFMGVVCDWSGKERMFSADQHWRRRYEPLAKGRQGITPRRPGI